jgi:hypothetical protein
MSDVYDTYELPNEYKLVIYYDRGAGNPREEFEHAAMFACGHENGNYGDRRLSHNGTRDIVDIVLSLMYNDAESKYLSEAMQKKGMAEYRRLFDARQNLDYYTSDDTIGSRSLERLRKVLEETALVVPIYKYEHGGVALKTGPFHDPWDSGLLGYAIMTNSKIRESFGGGRYVYEGKECKWVPGTGIINKKRRKMAEDLIDAEVAEYSAYLNGEVYGFQLFNECGDEESSCWGFYGLQSIPAMLEHLDEKQAAYLRKTEPSLFCNKKQK